MKKIVGIQIQSRRAILSSNLNHACIDSRPHHRFCFLLPLASQPLAKNCEEPAKRRWLIPVIDHHSVRIRLETFRAL